MNKAFTGLERQVIIDNIFILGWREHLKSLKLFKLWN